MQLTDIEIIKQALNGYHLEQNEMERLNHLIYVLITYRENN